MFKCIQIRTLGVRENFHKERELKINLLKNKGNSSADRHKTHRYTAKFHSNPSRDSQEPLCSDGGGEGEVGAPWMMRKMHEFYLPLLTIKVGGWSLCLQSQGPACMIFFRYDETFVVVVVHLSAILLTTRIPNLLCRPEFLFCTVQVATIIKWLPRKRWSLLAPSLL